MNRHLQSRTACLKRGQKRIPLDLAAASLSFTVGVTDYPRVPPVFSDPQTYDAYQDYKLNFLAAARFLSFRIDYPDYKTMSLSGFDLDATGFKAT